MHKGKILAIGEMVTNRGYGLNGEMAVINSLKSNSLIVITNIASYFGNQKMPIHNLPAGYIAQQLLAAFDHQSIDAIKVGFIKNPDGIHTVCDYFDKHPKAAPIVVNPVLLSATGEHLFDDEIMEVLLSRLIQHADLLVLNIAEAEIISGIDIMDQKSLQAATAHIYELGAKGIFITGGVLQGNEVFDSLIYQDQASLLQMPKSQQQLKESYRYSGAWAIATAITVGLGQGLEIMTAINRARSFIDTAIATAFKTDASYQNLNITHTVEDFGQTTHYKPYTLIKGRL